ncbi:MAG: hypothetical protein GC159_20460 [Phycisphaera sp.]|nr:hypothetical protein [Phycisphaera sp.]
MHTPYTTHRATSRRSRGFTIVELLVVVTIIIALLVLIMPTYETAVERGEIVKCQSNQHQIYGGLLAYAGDFFMQLPDDHWATNSDEWDQWRTDINGNKRIAPYTQVDGTENPGGALWPYMHSEDVFLCPTFARLAVGLTGDVRRKPCESYSMSEVVWRDGGWQGQAGVHKLMHDENVRYPSQTLLVADESPFPTAVSNVRINNQWLGVSATFSDPTHSIDGVATYHMPLDKNYNTGNGNVLFYDGHIALTPQVTPLDSKKLAFPVAYHQWLDTLAP